MPANDDEMRRAKVERLRHSRNLYNDKARGPINTALSHGRSVNFSSATSDV